MVFQDFLNFFRDKKIHNYQLDFENHGVPVWESLQHFDLRSLEPMDLYSY